ncbi:MAG TPA: GatB/YqeY domain-containing protein [Candidatus Limnocylindria bacterium]|jgi:uncharacterized protein YqeY|nr:GatB/YqeY domain-containing protein [Candidatus Limnocylindria bacterium]
MTLNEKIVAELKASMMARDADRTGTLRLIKSAIGYLQVEKKVDLLSDEDTMAVLQREAKKRRDSIDQFDKGGRPDLAEKERVELKVIEDFLPKALSAEELEALVKTVIAEIGATSKKEMGAVVKAVQARSGGRADGRTVSGIVGKLLP